MVVPCPVGYGPGSVIGVQAPAAPVVAAPPSTMPLDVIVPAGVTAGMTFHVQYQGLKIGVQCPPGVVPGQQIRIQVPRS